jgi:hypothetical protein
MGRTLAKGTLDGLDRATGHRAGRLLVTLTLVGGALAGCGIHISKNGVSGNILGHSFSGSKGSLPAGFPSQIPIPDDSRVLVGGGTDSRWDVAFAVTGSLATGTSKYQHELGSAGYTVTGIQTGSTADTEPSGSAATGTSTTVTLNGEDFSAHNSQWTIQVVSGTTTASSNGELKPGEFAINITAVPTSSITTTTTS